MKALGAFIFHGGFSIGVKRSGMFEVLAHLEGDGGYGHDTMALNWPGFDVRFPHKKWNIDDFTGVDFIYANPPCAIFSPMGIATTQGPDAWRKDPRLQCWHDSFMLLEKLKPRAWALESVPQAYTKGREVVDDFTKRALMMGYSVTHLLINAMYMGIPQKRKRFFLVMHRPPMLLGANFLNWAPPPTVSEALAAVDFPGHITDPGRAPLFEAVKKTPPGGRIMTTWMELNPGYNERRNKQGKVIGRPSFQERRLHPDEQMGAFVGDKFYHPTENRMIGENEAKALCGFPLDWQLAGNPRGWMSHLARGVMPPVAEWLARAIGATLGRPDAAVKEDRRVTLVDLREPDIAPVDLTGEYLDAKGRVRFVVKSGKSTDPLAIENDFPDEDEATTALRGAVVRGSTQPITTRQQSDFDEWNDDDGQGDQAHPANVGSTLRAPIAPTCEICDGAGQITVKGNDRPCPMCNNIPLSDPAASGIPRRAQASITSPEPRISTPRQSRSTAPVPVGEAPPDAEAPLDREGSGKYIQRMFMTGKYTGSDLVNMVHKFFPGRNTRLSDVYYNYRKLIEAKTPNLPPYRAGNQARTPGRVHNPRPVRAPVERPTGSSSDGNTKPVVEPSALATSFTETKTAPNPRPEGESRPDQPRALFIEGYNRPKILMTGFTSNQSRAKPEGKSFNKIDIPQLVADELGKHVDLQWWAPVFGEPIHEIDGAIIFMGSILGLTGCKYGPLAVWTIAEMLRQRKPVVIFYDDWQVTMNHHQLGYTARSFDGAPFKRLVEYGKIDADLLTKHKSIMIETMQTLASDNWPNEWAAAILKFSGHGDAHKFTNRIGAATIFPVDPTPVAVPFDWDGREYPKEREWFLAALGNHSGWVNDLKVTWPIKTIGHKQTGGKVDTERDVFNLTASCRGTLSYPYDHGGSGWFRSRFVYAALAGTVMVADKPDAEALGGPYLYSLAEIEPRSDEDLRLIAAEQREHLFTLISTERSQYERDILDIVNFFKGE